MTYEIHGADNDEERTKLLGGIGANQLKGEYAESINRLKNFCKNAAKDEVSQISLLIEAALSQASAATTTIAGSQDRFKLQQLAQAAGNLSNSVISRAPGANVEKNISDFGKALTAMNVEEITQGIATDQQVAKTDDPESSHFQANKPHKPNVDLQT